MGLKLSLELGDQLTWGQLYRFADLARAAGIKDEEPVTIETDGHGDEIIGLAVELGNLDGLTRPVIIDGAAAREYANSLYAELQQESDNQTDGPVLERLLNDLYAGIDASR